MNNLRLPIAILVLIIVGLGAWFVLARPSFTSSVATSFAATTSQSASDSQTAPALDPSAVASAIPGVWQSTDDQNYTVDITSNGKWTDSYKSVNAADDVSETGTYTFFTTTLNPDPDFTGTMVPGVVYIKLVEGSDTYYYSVINASGNDLQLSYLARGNTLSFKKIQ